MWSSARIFVGVVCFLVAVGVALPASAADGELDGRTFTVTVTEEGSDEGSPDTLIFADGTFRSTACDEYGFEPAEYSTRDAEDGFAFTADAVSEAEGTNHWEGVVRGDRIEGTFVWSKPGQDPIEYRFEGSAED